MAEKIVKWLLGCFSGLLGLSFGKELVVFLIALMPILELRGALIAAALLDVDPVVSYIIAIIGNIIPVPFILWFIESILDWMSKVKIKWMNKLAKWVKKKADKHKHQIETYGFWGLVFFVGIPLPGTGAWTGCLIAALLGMDKKKAFLAAMIGIFMASIIMMILSFGVIKGITG